MNMNITVSFLFIIILGALRLERIDGVANSLQDCLNFAALFPTNECSATPYDSVGDVPGTDIACTKAASNSFWELLCTNFNGTYTTFQSGPRTFATCTWKAKLCVSCFLSDDGSGGQATRIRVQTNGLPSYCPTDASRAGVPLDYDFEVDFNPDVRAQAHAPHVSVSTVSELNDILCLQESFVDVPVTSNYLNYTTPSSFGTALGIGLGGVELGSPNSGTRYNGLRVDPFYPPTECGYCQPENLDTALTHPNFQGALHTHIMTYFSTGQLQGEQDVTGCSANNGCKTDLKGWALNSFEEHKTLTPIGIAKDGHIVYGPYGSDGNLLNSSLDVCNGNFLTSEGDYGYVGTTTFPYLAGCFGPGNYPEGVFAECTANSRSEYGSVNTFDDSTPTVEPSAIPTTETPTTAKPSVDPTVHPTTAPSAIPSDTPTTSPSDAPTIHPTTAPSTTPTNMPTASPSNVPTAHPTTIAPSATPSVMPTALPSAGPSAGPTTSTPSAAPSTEPSISPSELPTVHPTTATPSADPSPLPTAKPSTKPSTEPSTETSAEPSLLPLPISDAPSTAPSILPTMPPSSAPSAGPTTVEPSAFPSDQPTADPTLVPSPIPTALTGEPTAVPTQLPSAMPTTAAPSSSPSVKPTALPSADPTTEPTIATPTAEPSNLPTVSPSANPSAMPTTTSPSAAPSDLPTAVPTFAPSPIPTTPNPTALPGVPTALPTESPSAQPTTASPTAAPSGEPTSNLPSVEPTAAPSAGSSESQTPSPTDVPTTQPTDVISLVFYVTQEFSGFSYADYESDSSLFESILSKGLMELINYKAVVDIVNVEEASIVQRQHIKKRITSTGFSVEYEILVEDATKEGYASGEEAYEALKSEISDGASNGNMTLAIQEAAKTESAVAFYNTTADTSITSTDALYPTASPTILPESSPAGIENVQLYVLIAVCTVGLCFLLGAVYACIKNLYNIQRSDLHNPRRRPKSASPYLESGLGYSGGGGYTGGDGYEMSNVNPLAARKNAGPKHKSIREIDPNIKILDKPKAQTGTQEDQGRDSEEMLPGGVSYTLPML